MPCRTAVSQSSPIHRQRTPSDGLLAGSVPSVHFPSQANVVQYLGQCSGFAIYRQLLDEASGLLGRCLKQAS